MTKELNFFEQDLFSTAQKNLDFQAPSSVEKKTSEALQKNEEEARLALQLREHLKKVVESLLFASKDPIPLDKIREITKNILPLKPKELRAILAELKEEYESQKRSFQLEEIAEGFILRTHEEYAPYLDLLYREKRAEKLSHASTEVLAIIAYRQPITRSQIDAIRGVDSSGPVMQLLERQLIEPVGKLETVGRPTLYGTTKEFLKHFGLKDLKDLKHIKIETSSDSAPNLPP